MQSAEESSQFYTLFLPGLHQKYLVFWLEGAGAQWAKGCEWEHGPNGGALGPPLPSFLGNMKIKVKGGFVFWNILSGDFWYTSLSPNPLPRAQSHISSFFSSILVFGQEAAHFARLAHLSMEMPSQSYDGELCPWILKWDNMRNKQESWRAFLNHLQKLRWGHCLLCDQMSPK